MYYLNIPLLKRVSLDLWGKIDVTSEGFLQLAAAASVGRDYVMLWPGVLWHLVLFVLRRSRIVHLKVWDLTAVKKR